MGPRECSERRAGGREGRGAERAGGAAGRARDSVPAWCAGGGSVLPRPGKNEPAASSQLVVGLLSPEALSGKLTLEKEEGRQTRARGPWCSSPGTALALGCR